MRMTLIGRLRRISALFAVVLVFALLPLAAQEPANASSSSTPGVVQQHDGQHDFDWEIGKWKLHISRLVHPLSGSKEWIELNGTVVARPIWDGKGNFAEIRADGPNGQHLEFLSLRLYNPKARQWTLNFASSISGVLSVPKYGEFKDRRGEFYDQEDFNGRMIFVRFLFFDVSPDSGRSEQAFSNDGGKTWETNWINT